MTMSGLDDYWTDAFSDGDDYEDLLMGEDLVEPSGRVAFANRVRYGTYAPLSVSDHRQAYLQGVADALNVLPEKPRYGVWAALIPGIAEQLQKRASGEVQGSVWEQLGEGVSTLATGAVGGGEGGFLQEGAGLVDGLFRRQDAAPPSGSEPASVEADSRDLPPVYVADPQGASEVVEGAAQVGNPSHELGVLEDFGPSASYGFVGSQSRSRARFAALQACRAAADKVRYGAATGDRPCSFVEDPGARPLLMSDGRLLEVVYGSLSPLPCPSCGHSREQAVHDCGFCDGHGAVLVPSSDVGSWRSIRSGYLVPTVVPDSVFGAEKSGFFDSIGKGLGEFWQGLTGGGKSSGPSPQEVHAVNVAQTEAGLADLDVEVDDQDDVGALVSDIDALFDSFGAAPSYGVVRVFEPHL